MPPEFEGKSVSLCFRAPKPGEKVDSAYQWLGWRVGANWRHPEGEKSDLEGLGKHPVVHVCYLKTPRLITVWAGKRLPTEAEWEYAARGGLVTAVQAYVWGAEFRPDGRWMANTWQGHFPDERKVEDGFAGTAPVGSFPANGYGLYDMAGNVWQITEDWYRPDTYATLASNPDWAARRNPKGPQRQPDDPDEPGLWKKGHPGAGSFMCKRQLLPGLPPERAHESRPGYRPGKYRLSLRQGRRASAVIMQSWRGLTVDLFPKGFVSNGLRTSIQYAPRQPLAVNLPRFAYVGLNNGSAHPMDALAPLSSNETDAAKMNPPPEKPSVPEPERIRLVRLDRSRPRAALYRRDPGALHPQRSRGTFRMNRSTLHVVWAWATGRLPYRDVFDNHSPLFGFVFSPLFRLVGERNDIVDVVCAGSCFRSSP